MRHNLRKKTVTSNDTKLVYTPQFGIHEHTLVPEHITTIPAPSATPPSQSRRNQRMGGVDFTTIFMFKWCHKTEFTINKLKLQAARYWGAISW